MPNTPGFKVVVIEDSPHMQVMITDFLQQKMPDAIVVAYPTGEKALKDLQSAPDLFILDYNLDSINPGAMNGLQVFLKLKELFNSPVVFLSAQERTDVSANIIKYGAYDYVVKNEESFHRLEIILKNVIADQSNRKQLLTQKSSINALIVILVSIIAALLLFKVL